MTQTVWKYTLQADDIVELDLPLGAKPLSIQEQNGEPQLWVLVNPNEQVYEKRVFRLSGTGHPITNENLQFIGTFQLYGGSFVGHLFEILES
jgi:hypothetical protein